MTKGSTWNKWDFHLHTPYSVLNNQFGDCNIEETWIEYVDQIESQAANKGIVAIGITDYFMIDGYKKIMEYQKNGKLQDIFLIPNIEFRLRDIVIIDKGKSEDVTRLNMHVLLSPELTCEEIEENFLHELDFVYEQDSYESGKKLKLKKKHLESLGMKLRESHPPFKTYSDLEVGCMNATVDANQIKEKLEQNPIFKGKYLLVLADEKLSKYGWDSQGHATRKHLIQMSHAMFASNKKYINFCLGKNHSSVDDFIKEFKSLKPCIWGCDGHSFDQRFLEPDSDSNGITNYCWIKADVTWNGLKQILYEPDARVRIQEESPEPSKSIFTIDQFNIDNVNVNKHLKFEQKSFDLNHNLIAIIGGRGSGKTAILDLLASCFSEGHKLSDIKNSFFHRLYANKQKNKCIPVKLSLYSGNTFEKQIGKDEHYIENTDILYVTQNHFEEFSSDYSKLNKYVIDLIFQRFPDEKREYEEYDSLINSYRNEIQKFNLQIQQLMDKIGAKTEIEAELMKKNGSKLDYESKIKSIEDSSEINEEVNKLTSLLNDLRTKKEKTESLIHKIDVVSQKKDGFNDYISDLNEINDSLNVLADGQNETFNLLPIENFLLILDKIESISSDNRKILLQNSETYKTEIIKVQQKINNFSDVNKHISELKEKYNLVLAEIKKFELQIAEIDSLQKQIETFELMRFKCYKSYIDCHIKWEKFVNSIILKFEDGKNNILNNLTFDVSLSLNKEQLLEGIDEKINHKYITVDLINIEFQNRIFSEIENKIISEKIHSETECDILHKNIDSLGVNYYKKTKKYITYSDFYNSLFENPLSLDVNLKLDNIPLENQSMGQRAIVLLKIILAYDDKPLIIDQPEEDLDNKYIYDQLVSAFREAKDNRQIIIATHNANLVVNTDADQIIVATCEDGVISYNVGTLENKYTQESVKNILEGGETAFKKREEKYGFKF